MRREKEKRKKKKKEERRKRKKRKEMGGSSLFGFMNPEFIPFPNFQNKVSFIHKLVRVSDILQILVRAQLSNPYLKYMNSKQKNLKLT